MGKHTHFYQYILDLLTMEEQGMNLHTFHPNKDIELMCKDKHIRIVVRKLLISYQFLKENGNDQYMNHSNI